MVDEVLPDPREIDRAGDPVAAEMIRGPDAGQHEKLRGDEGPCGEDDLVVRVDLVVAAILAPVQHTDRAPVLDQDPAHSCVEAHGQVRVAGHGSNERVGRAAALAAPVHELIEPDAPLRRPVEVVIVRLAQSLDRLNEPAGEVIDVARIGDQQRPVRVMKVVVEPVVSFHRPEVREDIGPTPTRVVVLAAQDLVPLLVVGRATAHINLGVY